MHGKTMSIHGAAFLLAIVALGAPAAAAVVGSLGAGDADTGVAHTNQHDFVPYFDLPVPPDDGWDQGGPRGDTGITEDASPWGGPFDDAPRDVMVPEAHPGLLDVAAIDRDFDLDGDFRGSPFGGFGGSHSQVPAPGALSLIGLAVLSLARRRRRR